MSNVQVILFGMLVLLHVKHNFLFVICWITSWFCMNYSDYSVVEYDMLGWLRMMNQKVCGRIGYEQIVNTISWKIVVNITGLCSGLR
jgi:hypothetical protein